MRIAMRIPLILYYYYSFIIIDARALDCSHGITFRPSSKITFVQLLPKSRPSLLSSVSFSPLIMTRPNFPQDSISSSQLLVIRAPALKANTATS